jgi:hypothetical protein
LRAPDGRLVSVVEPMKGVRRADERELGPGVVIIVLSPARDERPALGSFRQPLEEVIGFDTSHVVPLGQTAREVDERVRASSDFYVRVPSVQSVLFF